MVGRRGRNWRAVKVAEPVNRDQEMSAIGYLLAKQQPSPTVMFEKAEGFDDGGIGARLLWNLAGPSLKRIAITLGEDLKRRRSS